MAKSHGARLLVFVLAVVSTTGCPNPEPSPGVKVQIGSLSVQPATVHARPSVSFELRALPRSKANGFLVPEVLRNPETGEPVENTAALKVEWSVDPAGSLVEVQGLDELQHRARVVVHSTTRLSSDDAASDTLHYDIIAEGGGEVGRSRIVVIVDTTGVVEDIVETDDPSGHPPAFVLIDADDDTPAALVDPTQCAVQDLLLAVAGRGIVGSLYSGSCNRAILLRTQSAAHRDDAAMWSDAAHRLDMQAVTAPAEIPVALWLVSDGSEPTNAEDWAKTDIEVAQSILTETRTGIRLETVSSGPAPTTPLDLNGAILEYRWDNGWEFPCDDLQEQMADPNAPGAFDKYIIHLFFVPGRRLAHRHGEWCEPIEGKRGAIIIYWKERLPTVLAHELGHVLGLEHYCDLGGPSCVIADSLIAKGGRDAANVLAKGPDLLVPHINSWSGASRSWLTVGQVFRMNWFALSFMEHARLADYSDAAPKVLPAGSTDHCFGQARCPPEETGAIP